MKHEAFLTWQQVHGNVQSFIKHFRYLHKNFMNLNMNTFD